MSFMFEIPSESDNLLEDSSEHISELSKNSSRELPQNPSLYASGVSCGFPSPAEDYVETPLDLNELLIKKPAATFFVRAKGDSMEGAGIFDGDLLIIDRSIQPMSGHIVLAVLGGDFALKRFHQARGQVWLRPENSKYQPIEVTTESDFTIWGVLTHSIHNHKIK
jgi:DNA polymerase V